MFSFVEIKADNVQLSPGLKVLKAHDYLSYLDSKDLIDAAHSQAKNVVSKAQLAFETEKQSGYQDGLEKAKIEHAQTMLLTLAKCNNYYLEVEKEMTAVVLDAVRKIIDTFDDADITLNVVREALQQLANQKQVILYVHPDQVHNVREKVSTMLSHFHEVAYVNVMADVRLTSGGCILETEVGIVDASIDSQLDALKKAMVKQLSDRQLDVNNEP